jgi:hypothetical protein
MKERNNEDAMVVELRNNEHFRKLRKYQMALEEKNSIAPRQFNLPDYTN